MSALNTLAAYKFVKLLSTKFEDWDAYKLGLIDKDGNTLKKAESNEDKKALGMFEKLIKNVKLIFHKAPLGAVKIGSLVVALKLLKEDAERQGYDYSILESKLVEEYSLQIQLNESVEDETLEAGKYTDEDNNMYVVFEELHPSDTILGVGLYEIKNVVSRNTTFMSKSTLTKI